MNALPWSRFAGRSDGETRRARALTLEQGVAVVATIMVIASGFVVLVNAITTTTGERFPKNSFNWSVIGIVCAVIAGAGFFLHFRFHSGPDIHPDILGELFPLQHILEIDCLHLTAFGFQHGRHCRVVLIFQNLVNAPSRIRAEFTGKNLELPSLNYEVPRAALAAAWVDFPAPEVQALKIGAQIQRSGDKLPRVRFARRTHLGRYFIPKATAIAMGTGAIVSGLATGRTGEVSDLARELYEAQQELPPAGIGFLNYWGKLRIALQEYAQAIPPSQMTWKWKTQLLWTPSEPFADRVSDQIFSTLCGLRLEYSLPDVEDGLIDTVSNI